MKNYIFAAVFTLGLFLFACNENSDKADAKDKNKTSTAIIDVDLKTLYNNPGEYIDKEVFVSGIVDHICKHGGKKIFLVQDDKNIKIMSTEKFDENLVGKNIKVKAVFKEERIDEQFIKEWETEVREHHKNDTTAAECKNKLNYINKMKDSIASLEKGYISNYYMDFVSFDNAKNKNEIVSDESK